MGEQCVKRGGRGRMESCWSVCDRVECRESEGKGCGSGPILFSTSMGKGKCLGNVINRKVPCYLSQNLSAGKNIMSLAVV